ncbi:MAG: hypothetical protein IJ767_03900 [Bacteroidaceae bacterium]|nr:hypothetical protein [Bacteroidaceae bacterium]
MEGLALQIEAKDSAGAKRWEWVTLAEDTSISIEMSSPIFGTGATFSYPFTIPVEANRHILGNADQLHGARLHDLLHKCSARLYLLGIPFRKGIIRLDKEVKVTPGGDVEIEFTSERGEWDEMIDGMNARDVEIRNDILIGVALNRGSRIGLPYHVKTNLRVDVSKSNLGNNYYGYNNAEIDLGNVMLDQVEGNGQKWPKYVLARGTFKDAIGDNDLDFGEKGTGARDSVINVSEPFNPDAPELHPFCNIRLCYQRHILRKSNDEYEEIAARGYSISGAERANSAPNFFVLYWLYRLFKQLKIAVAGNALNNIEDMRRLFFVNTKCAYEEAPTIFMDTPYSPSARYGEYYFGFNPVYTGTYLPVGDDKEHAVGAIIDNDKCYALNVQLVSIDTQGQDIGTVTVGFGSKSGAADNTEGHYLLKVSRFESNGEEGYRRSAITGFGNKAFATSENLPNEDVSKVLESLEKMCGARFIFDDSLTSVRIILLRDVLRDTSVQELHAEVLDVEKTESSIKGFRITYGDKDDTNYSLSSLLLGSQSDAIKRTDAYYNAYGSEAKASVFNAYALKALGTRLRSDVPYSRLINSVTSFDKSLYYMPESGNLHAINVDKDAKGYADLHASLFEVAQFIAAEDGDCSVSDETEEILLDITPAVMNDVAIADEQAGLRSTQQFALFVDADMKSKYDDAENNHDAKAKVGDKNVEQWGLMAACGDAHFTKRASVSLPVLVFNGVDAYGNPVWSSAEIPATLDIEGVINEGFVLYPDDNFDPGDDGESPIESQDWGLTMCIMRGGGNDASIAYYAPNYDGEGNSRWAPVAGGDYASHPDGCDNYGNQWDYNGNREGLQDTGITYTGYQYGDLILSNAGAANQCDLKTRKGAVPSGTDIFATIDTYYTSAGSRLRILTDKGYYATIVNVTDKTGTVHVIWLCCVYNGTLRTYDEMLQYTAYLQYVDMLSGLTAEESAAYRPADVAEILSRDASLYNMIIAVDGYVTEETLKQACYYYLKGNDTVGSQGYPEGRFSLKPRAEKPNPNYDPSQPESSSNSKYLAITDPLNARRGLADVFYSEYSEFVRRRRIATLDLKIELSELLRIDFTKRYRIGDIVGFINKVSFNADKDGIADVKIEMYYL